MEGNNAMGYLILIIKKAKLLPSQAENDIYNVILIVDIKIIVKQYAIIMHFVADLGR